MHGFRSHENLNKFGISKFCILCPGMHSLLSIHECVPPSRVYFSYLKSKTGCAYDCAPDQVVFFESHILQYTDVVRTRTSPWYQRWCHTLSLHTVYDVTAEVKYADGINDITDTNSEYYIRQRLEHDDDVKCHWRHPTIRRPQYSQLTSWHHHR